MPTTSIVRRESNPPSLLRSLHSAARLLLTVLGLLVATAASAQTATTATFTLQDKTNLTSGTYRIYVTGFSTAGPNGPLILQADGSWAVPTPPVSPATTVNGTLPCYRFSKDNPQPGDISQIQINGAQTSISARVYYFIVTDTTTFPHCNPTAGNTGLVADRTVVRGIVARQLHPPQLDETGSAR